jgi:hypothetical protein
VLTTRLAIPLLLQTRHPAFMYVVSELLKIFCAETAADGSMRPILTALIGSSCQGLTTLQVSRKWLQFLWHVCTAGCCWL